MINFLSWKAHIVKQGVKNLSVFCIICTIRKLYYALWESSLYSYDLDISRTKVSHNFSSFLLEYHIHVNILCLGNSAVKIPLTWLWLLFSY